MNVSWKWGTILAIFVLTVAGSYSLVFAQQPQPTVFLPFTQKQQSGTTPTNICSLDPSPSIAENSPIRIVGINKIKEEITLRNISQNPVSINGWIVCSMNGDEQYKIPQGFNMNPNVILYLSLEGKDIWNDIERDDAALYDANGKIISYLIN
ncbi:hypothetical protein ACP8Y2_09820 [Herpetosiphon llansteffanensis]